VSGPPRFGGKQMKTEENAVNTKFCSFKVTSIFCINSLLGSSVGVILDKTKLLPSDKI